MLTKRAQNEPNEPKTSKNRAQDALTFLFGGLDPFSSESELEPESELETESELGSEASAQIFASSLIVS